jgi:tetratricopeptide (TPR) repeat protein
MAKDVNVRYQSATAMLADLRRMEHALQGSVLNTRPLTPYPGSYSRTGGARLSRTIQSVPRRVKIGVGLFALIVLGVWFAFQIWQTSPHRPSPEAQTWYDLGIRDMRAGTFYQASKELEQAIAIDDGFALAHARLAAAYLEIDNTDKAREELLRALSLVPDRSALTSHEANYLDAVAATVRREFPKAIEYYREIANNAPDSEKSSAYVDLGRAYERDEQIDKAQEYYLAATTADPQSASAFLRLAIIYGRRQDSKAADTFSEAERIYRLSSNQEGVAESFFQRGVLFAKVKKLPEAKALLEDALKTAQNLPDNKYQLVKTQLQLSGVYSNAGDTELAKKVATEAIDLARKSRIQNLATNGLIDLGYVFHSRGEFKDAREIFQQALDFAQRDKAPGAEARAMRALGFLNQQQGNPDEAISCNRGRVEVL